MMECYGSLFTNRLFFYSFTQTNMLSNDFKNLGYVGRAALSARNAASLRVSLLLTFHRKLHVRNTSLFTRTTFKYVTPLSCTRPSIALSANPN